MHKRRVARSALAFAMAKTSESERRARLKIIAELDAAADARLFHVEGTTEAKRHEARPSPTSRHLPKRAAQSKKNKNDRSGQIWDDHSGWLPMPPPADTQRNASAAIGNTNCRSKGRRTKRKRLGPCPASGKPSQYKMHKSKTGRRFCHLCGSRVRLTAKGLLANHMPPRAIVVSGGGIETNRRTH
jgi:hypothetical protein